jgi:hypothetical protein
MNNTSSLCFDAIMAAPSLIVNAPPQKRIRTAKKSVQISPLSHRRTYQLGEHKRGSKSHTKADYRRFVELRNHDVIKYSILIARKVRSGEPLTKEDLCLCTGLEAFLSPDVPRRIQKVNQARETHVKMILTAQEKGCGSDIISRLSKKSSKSALARAQNMAMASYSASD